MADKKDEKPVAAALPAEAFVGTRIPSPATDGPYRMDIDMRVLDHLGIHLYSNAAAVLSEAVANAWDADAELVKVQIDPDSIVVEDDGVGMDIDTINSRFLYVGYNKRVTEGVVSDKKRAFMGRKGIGKLSLFSIAETVTVHTCKGTGSQQHAFKMVVKDIKDDINAQRKYHPKPVSYEGPVKGTRIVLTGLKKRRVGVEQSLRKRIARRFSVIGYKGPGDDQFQVHVNGKPIDHNDRDDLKHIEFLWEFGSERIDKKAHCPNLKKSAVIDYAVDSAKGWIVTGWLGAAPRPTDLKNDEAGSMNGIVLVARGRLIHENILEKLDFNKLLGSYITGQVQADFLDLDDMDDIATSDRQRLIEDDDRYVALTKFLRETMNSLAGPWSTWRLVERSKEATSTRPQLEAWIEHLPEGQRVPARKMLGLIEGVEVEAESDRAALYRAGVLAFERLTLKHSSHRLGELSELTAEKLLPLLEDLSTLEGSMYRDIVKERLAVIEKFTGLVDDNQREQVLQKTIFNNMWLLDPGWERATESVRMEQKLKTEYKEFADDLTEEQSKGRLDIRYRTNAGQHIIVELKRAKRVMTLGELIDQGQRYREGLTECVKAAEGDHVQPNVAIVFVLGRPVNADPTQVAQMMIPMNARIVYYETLIQNSHKAYAEFLERTEKADAIDALVKSL